MTNVIKRYRCPKCRQWTMSKAVVPERFKSVFECTLCKCYFGWNKNGNFVQVFEVVKKKYYFKKNHGIHV